MIDVCAFDFAGGPVAGSAASPTAAVADDRTGPRARTWMLPHAPESLLCTLPVANNVVSFVHHGFGLVGWGEFASITATGADAAAQIQQWFKAQLSVINTAAQSPAAAIAGSGPVCFVSLGFSPDDPSVAVIPRYVIGRDAGHDNAWFMTSLADAGAEHIPPTPPEPITSPGAVSWADAQLSATGFTTAIMAAIRRIKAGEAEKVVVAHGLDAHTEFPVDERFLLQRLAEQYPSTVAFAVAGLVGASPETLVRRRGDAVFSRVLAGTVWPDTAEDSAHAAASARLQGDAKQRAEHGFSVRSVADVLAPLTSALSVPAEPSVLSLANLQHLATDVTGTLLPDTASGGWPSALDIAAALHPTAAVGGTPSQVAQQIIAELEPTPRGRYAAPVGWMDARGDGEFVIALRCAQVSGHAVRLMAGCGIVADSDPETETREAQIKMIPVRDALESAASS